MSQNSHTLLLFFDDEQKHKDCLLMFLKLNSGENRNAQYYAERLSVDVSDQWENSWFNHAVAAKPEYIRIDYDTSTHEDMPLEVLRQLFSAGMNGAVLDTFYDQVGEYSRHHFLDGKLVNQEMLYQGIARSRTITESMFNREDEDEDDYSVTVDTPVSIDDLIKQENKREENAQEMVNALLELGKVARETGSSPVDVARSVLVLRALGKGLLQALIFGVVTALLFQGMWLWIVLAIVLAVVLPLFYVTQVAGEFEDEVEGVADAD